MACYTSHFFSRFSVLINYTMWSSNVFLRPAVSHVFHGPSFSGFMFSMVCIFQGPCFPGSRFLLSEFFWVQVFTFQVFQGPGLCGSRFLKVRVLGLRPGFRSSQFARDLRRQKYNALQRSWYKFFQNFVWYVKVNKRNT